jgi:predicted nucleotidyltransferase
MSSKDEILNYLSAHQERFKKLYNLNKIGIFGSYARDEATPNSDIDIVQIRDRIEREAIYV